jgi:hypothetical protein
VEQKGSELVGGVIPLNLKTFSKPSRNAGLITNLSATVLISCFLLFHYVQGPLGGDFNKFTMTSKSWGIPKVLLEHDVEPLYVKEGDFGWDGQFYYYMANDPFARSSIKENIDNAPYRYQRVGVPLIAFLLSKILFQDWVSPVLYYLTNLLLLLAGTLALSLSLRNIRKFWFLPLAWSLSSGTQITLLNGLIDPGADGLLALSIYFFIRKKPLPFLLFGCFAVLSKEIFILLPIVALGSICLKIYRKDHEDKERKLLLASAVMSAVWIGWQMYLKFIFKVFPFETTKGTDLVDFPFYITLKYMILGILGTYPRTPEGKFSYIAGLALTIYVLILFACIVMAFVSLRKYLFTNSDIVLISILILLFSCVFLSFGDTVIYNFSGYMKALSSIILLSIFLFSLLRIQISSKAILLGVLLFVSYSTNQVWAFRVDLPTVYNSVDKNCGHLEFEIDSSCYEKFYWPANLLPRINGNEIRVNNQKAVASGAPGMVTFGPYIKLIPGSYLVTFRISSTENMKALLDYQGTSLSNQNWPQTSLTGQGTESKIFTSSSQIDVNNDISNFESRIILIEGSIVIHELVIERIQR